LRGKSGPPLVKGRKERGEAAGAWGSPPARRCKTGALLSKIAAILDKAGPILSKIAAILDKAATDLCKA
jgi:hypothetical protein